MQPITDNTGGQQFILLNFLAYNNGIDSNYSRSSYIGPANASTIYTAGHLEQMLLASPIANAGYRAVPACVNITSQSYASVTFQMRDTKNSAALVLKPGEYTAICYGVCIDRTADTSNYTNQATLDVQPASDGGGWAVCRRIPSERLCSPPEGTDCRARQCKYRYAGKPGGYGIQGRRNNSYACIPYAYEQDGKLLFQSGG